jgi:hypothetical protein
MHPNVNPRTLEHHKGCGTRRTFLLRFSLTRNSSNLVATRPVRKFPVCAFIKHVDYSEGCRQDGAAVKEHETPGVQGALWYKRGQ